MKRSTVTKLGTSVLAVVLLCGCATLAKGPSDEELIKSALGVWTAGIKAKDIDKVMSVHSEKFESSEATGK